MTAATLLAEGLVDRILILDLDVHQGDGTAAIFGPDHPNVFTCSLHCEQNFPMRKQQSTLDVGLPAGVRCAMHGVTAGPWGQCPTPMPLFSVLRRGVCTVWGQQWAGFWGRAFPDWADLVWGPRITAQAAPRTRTTPRAADLQELCGSRPPPPGLHYGLQQQHNLRIIATSPTLCVSNDRLQSSQRLIASDQLSPTPLNGRVTVLS